MGASVNQLAKIPSARRDDPLDGICFSVGRVHYNYIGFLERLLSETKLDKHVAPGMGQILFALFEEDNRIIKDIGARVRLSPSTLTALLDRMCRTGLVTRHRDRADGRAVRVSLTPLARSLEPKCWELVDALEKTLQAGMSPEEIRTLKDLLSRVVNNISRISRD